MELHNYPRRVLKSSFATEEDPMLKHISLALLAATMLAAQGAPKPVRPKVKRPTPAAAQPQTRGVDCVVTASALPADKSFLDSLPPGMVIPRPKVATGNIVIPPGPPIQLKNEPYHPAPQQFELVDAKKKRQR
jgi:hypothetical protein